MRQSSDCVDDLEWHLRDVLPRSSAASPPGDCHGASPALLDALLELSPEARSELVRQVCEGDAETGQAYLSEFAQRLVNVSGESYRNLKDQNQQEYRAERVLVEVRCQDRCADGCEAVFKTCPETWERMGHPVPTSCHACRAWPKQEC
eukprot:TRINITY_DN19577_c0_g1_i1.p2 TRINITY_DN19577_c0_g1~~TRINITY_DN19577_c0_g1_i1.p2  ORF type:complete len:148 (-),score=33.14 TRINITY_DN19577_c0_g1_i1:352-795(-)